MTKEKNTQREMEQGNFKNLFEYYQFTKKDEKECPVVSRKAMKTKFSSLPSPLADARGSVNEKGS